MQKRYLIHYNSCRAPLDVILDVDEGQPAAAPETAVLSCSKCDGRIHMAVDHDRENIQVHSRQQVAVRWSVLVFLATCLLACGATKSEFVPSGGYVPRPPSPEVLVYFEGAPPDQPYEVVGMVYAEKEANTAARWDVVKAETVIGLLKAKAQAIGADAIIDVRVITLPHWATDYKKGEAKAIIFKRQ